MDTLNSTQKMRNSISTPFSIIINDYHVKAISFRRQSFICRSIGLYFCQLILSVVWKFIVLFIFSQGKLILIPKNVKEVVEYLKHNKMYWYSQYVYISPSDSFSYRNNIWGLARIWCFCSHSHYWSPIRRTKDSLNFFLGHSNLYIKYIFRGKPGVSRRDCNTAHKYW